ncbi:MAG: Transcription initiation factor IIA small chain (TFIIA 13.5 kDa subunit) [Bathelium mastoideum]|nr:MAG: Transcription initiation factor IIA small chain (TFIIA 13.5 kDa subunit) [Bathelium mastoideum]KAI9686278.1 MAG: Transcription initiation factor IIA small chain (TFIIA 13.5 kDa subunit) [Bathelium mastoideum]
MATPPRTQADNRQGSGSTAGGVGERAHDDHPALAGRHETEIDGWIADCRPAEFRPSYHDSSNTAFHPLVPPTSVRSNSTSLEDEQRELAQSSSPWDKKNIKQKYRKRRAAEAARNQDSTKDKKPKTRPSKYDIPTGHYPERKDTFAPVDRASPGNRGSAAESSRTFAIKNEADLPPQAQNLLDIDPFLHNSAQNPTPGIPSANPFPLLGIKSEVSAETGRIKSETSLEDLHLAVPPLPTYLSPAVPEQLPLTKVERETIDCPPSPPHVREARRDRMNEKKDYYELYRRSTLGVTLMDSLDELIMARRIEPQLAIKILSNFDKCMTEVLADKVKSRLNFKGHLDTYRFCDDVWTFVIKDINFKLDNQSSIHADKVKIVSCNNKKAEEK